MAITNRNEFEAWLKGQPRDVCVAIAYRAALRVLPLATDVETFDSAANVALTVFRSNLVSGVMSVQTTRKLTTAAHAARAAAAAAAETLRADNARAAADAAFAAAYAAGAAATSSGADASEAAYKSASAAAYSAADAALATPSGGDATPAAYTAADAALAAARAAAYADADIAPASLMKAEIDRSEELAFITDRSNDATNALLSGGPWTFWAEWYARAMAGDPLPWDLQEQIALIPNEVWEAGPEAVAKRIKDIEDAFYGRSLDAAMIDAAVEYLLMAPVVYADIFLSSAQSITFNIDQFQRQADLNCLPEGFIGFGDVAGSFDVLSTMLTDAATTDVEIVDLKGQIQTLHGVIHELRRELRETRRDLISTPRPPEEVDRLVKIGRAARETILLTGGIAAGLLATLQLGDRWPDDYQGLRAEAHALVDVMESLESFEVDAAEK